MLSLTSHTDTHGNPTSGPQDAVDRYDAAIGHLLAYHEQLVDAATSLATDEPEFPMGQILGAYLALTTSDQREVPAAEEVAAHLDTLPLNHREVAHRAAIGTWLAGDWHGAARRLDELLIRWPTDLLGLIVGHLLDFYLGDSANLRDRVGRSLPMVDPAHPHHGYVRGMYAFGLEESGNYQLAEQHGLAAVDANIDDVWAIHAVTHVYEMQGRIDEGIRFLRGNEASWGSGNLFTVHNWWHLALYLLEAERSGQALAIYDRHVHNDRSAVVPLEMLDASALLWRLELDGIATGDRFAALADAWATRTSEEPWYVFNDVHAVMALAGAGRLADARAVIDRLDAYVATAAPSSNVRMTAEVGLPACRSVLAYAEDRHADVVAELLPIRTILARFGGSHAQRDALQRTLVASALQARRLDLARGLLNERIGLRETSVWSWRQRAHLFRAIGDSRNAERADGRAASYASWFATAET
jgi:tetratricopeptide (TPR) repeat protein